MFPEASGTFSYVVVHILTMYRIRDTLTTVCFTQESRRRAVSVKTRTKNTTQKAYVMGVISHYYEKRRRMKKMGITLLTQDP
jgi:hypothetical protein